MTPTALVRVGLGEWEEIGLAVLAGQRVLALSGVARPRPLYESLRDWEAVLGAQVSVPTLGGRIGIKIPPSAQNAQKMRIRGHGLPLREGGRGDLYVVLHVQVPERIGERERALWEQLARESRFNPRD